tara:strand:+ start:80 stop:1750 length:1671 start_codon:yes stop_codon:yes gene_type:complete
LLLKAGQYRDRDGNEFPYSNINISVRRHLLGEIVGQSDAEFLDDLDDILEASEEMSGFSKSKFIEHIKNTSEDLLSGTIKELLGPLSTKDFSLPKKVREVSLQFRTKEGTKQLEEPEEGEPQFSPLDTRTFEEYPEYNPSDLDLSNVKVDPPKRKDDKETILITFNEIENLGNKGSKSKFLMSKGIRPTLETLGKNIETFDLIGPAEMDPKDVRIPEGKRKPKESREAKRLYFFQLPVTLEVTGEISNVVATIEDILDLFDRIEDAKTKENVRVARELFRLHKEYYMSRMLAEKYAGKDSTKDYDTGFQIFDIISETTGSFGKRGFSQIKEEIEMLFNEGIDGVKLPKKIGKTDLRKESNNFIQLIDKLISLERVLQKQYDDLSMSDVPEEYFAPESGKFKYSAQQAKKTKMDDSLEARLRRIFEQEEREKKFASEESKVEKAEVSDDKIAEDIFEGKKDAAKKLVMKYIRTDYDLYEYEFKIERTTKKGATLSYARAKIIGNLRPSIVPKDRDSASYTILETVGELKREEKEQLYSALREIRINEEDLEDYLKEV